MLKGDADAPLQAIEDCDYRALQGWGIALIPAQIGSRRGHPPLPQALRGVFHDGHGLLGWLMLALLVMKYHVTDRDRLTGRMLP